MKELIILFSSSLIFDEAGGIRRARRSRVGLERCTFRMTSLRSKKY